MSAPLPGYSTPVQLLFNSGPTPVPDEVLMPLNTAGEFIPELRAQYRVVPLSKWAETPHFQEAAQQAAIAFREAGAMLPIRIEEDDVVVQEYPALNKVVFLFQRRIAGKEKFVERTYDLSEPFVAALRAQGLWSDNVGRH